VTAVESTLRRLEVAGQLTPDVFDELIGDRELPLVEPAACTFAYRGEAEAVHLRHWGVGLPPDLAFRRIDGSDRWFLVVDLPAGARVEYKLEVVGEGGTRLIEDPRNPRHARNPFGANSVCEAAGYHTPEWVAPHASTPPGSSRELTVRSAALGRDATVTLHLPAGFSPTPAEPYPVVVVHDGGDYVRYASLPTVLDNLVHRHLAPPMVAALLHPRERLVEYADDLRHARFLADELVPALESKLPLVAAPAGRVLMGASFGAVASLATAWRRPGYFGRLLLQSGSFAWASNGCSHRRGALWQPVKDFVGAYTAEPRAVAERVFVTCGVYESLICENRALVPELRRAGMDVAFAEVLDGHNWEAWRNQLGDAFGWLLR
jgi:enterochelin esterase-like enzyme